MAADLVVAEARQVVAAGLAEFVAAVREGDERRAAVAEAAVLAVVGRLVGDLADLYGMFGRASGAAALN